MKRFNKFTTLSVATMELKRKAFGQFSSFLTQRPDTQDPVEIVLTNHEDMSGGEHLIAFKDGDIEIQQSGMYLIIAAPQIGRLSGSEPRWIDFWVRINNVDLPNSNIRAVLRDHLDKDVVVLQTVTRLNKGDIVNVMMSVESMDEGLGIECIQPTGEPTIPSIILTIVQM